MRSRLLDESFARWRRGILPPEGERRQTILRDCRESGLLALALPLLAATGVTATRVDYRRDDGD